MTLQQSSAQSELLLAIERWAGSPNVLARFFNTLSFLEHIGSRKILNSGIEYTSEELRHAFEETGHALRFKLISQKLDRELGDRYEEETMLGGISPKYYFQKLDASVRAFCNELAPSNARMTGYLLTTYVVEKRAASLYPAIQQIMESKSLPLSLRSIITDEDRHLEDIESSISAQSEVSSPDLEQLLALESAHFDRLTKRVIECGDALCGQQSPIDASVSASI